METLKLSARDIKDEYRHCASLSELIRAFEKNVEKSGRVICKVKVNGLNLSESDEHRLAETAIDLVGEIEFETENIGELTRQSIQTVIQFVGNLMIEVVDLAEAFRQQRSNETQNRFILTIKNAQSLTDALMALKPNLEHNEKRSAVFHESWKTNEIHMTHTLKEMIEAYERGDWVLLSDVLEYELYNSLQKWRDLLATS